MSTVFTRNRNNFWKNIALFGVYKRIRRRRKTRFGDTAGIDYRNSAYVFRNRFVRVSAQHAVASALFCGVSYFGIIAFYPVFVPVRRQKSVSFPFENLFVGIRLHDIAVSAYGDQRYCNTAARRIPTG